MPALDLISILNKTIAEKTITEPLGLDFIQLDTIQIIIATIPSFLLELGGELDAILIPSTGSPVFHIHDIPRFLLKVKDSLNRTADSFMRCKLGRMDALDFVKHVLFLTMESGAIKTDKPSLFKDNVETCIQLLGSSVDIYKQKPVDMGCGVRFW